VTTQPMNYRDDATAMIVGIGLMGQHLAGHVMEWLNLKKLILVDCLPTISVAGQPKQLTDFAEELSDRNQHATRVVAETLDVSSEDEVNSLFQRHGNVHYLQHTAGISPKPLTPPEELTKEDILNACNVNLWGAYNVITRGAKSGAFAQGARGVIILSTSATVGSEGRASAAYEVSKGGLMNFLTLQSRYLAERYGLILNALAPSPLRGPMAAQNATGAGRLQAVEDAMPLGSLVEPKHISAATTFFWSNECWCVGEVLTTDGGYTKHKPIYGPLTS
jgi:NAD(P)-dependent dehydrogenase (short-subunit alcohol dehydrogenase family)